MFLAFHALLAESDSIVILILLVCDFRLNTVYCCHKKLLVNNQQNHSALLNNVCLSIIFDLQVQTMVIAAAGWGRSLQLNRRRFFHKIRNVPSTVWNVFHHNQHDRKFTGKRQPARAASTHAVC